MVHVAGVPPRTVCEGDRRARERAGRVRKEAYKEGISAIVGSEVDRERKVEGKGSLCRYSISELEAQSIKYRVKYKNVETASHIACYRCMVRRQQRDWRTDDLEEG